MAAPERRPLSSAKPTFETAFALSAQQISNRDTTGLSLDFAGRIAENTLT
jgi:hypothetical protein